MDITFLKFGILTDTDLPGMIYGLQITVSYRKLHKDLSLRF